MNYDTLIKMARKCLAFFLADPEDKATIDRLKGEVASLLAENAELHKQVPSQEQAKELSDILAEFERATPPPAADSPPADTGSDANDGTEDEKTAATEGSGTTSEG